MELAEVGNGQVGRRVTSPLGPLKLQNIKGGKKALKSQIKMVMDDLVSQMGADHSRLFLVGGSWRAIARLDMERRGYPLHVLHEYRMTPKAVRATLKWIADNDISKLRARTGLSAARIALVPIACVVLAQLLKSFRPKEIAVSGSAPSVFRSKGSK